MIGLEATLGYREPCDVEGLLAFLAARAIPGIESAAGGVYRRSLRLAHGPGVVALAPGPDGITAALSLSHRADVDEALARCRCLLDLDADPEPILAVLLADPRLAEVVAAVPGRRVPGHVDPVELAVRAVLGQQVSVAGAATLAGRLVAAHGEPLAVPAGAVTHLFPTAAALAGADPARLPMPRARGRALVALAGALSDGALSLDAPPDLDAARRAMLALPGIGPWTADYIAMRALGDRDVFLATDLGVLRAVRARGWGQTPAQALALAQAWRPYRSYAMIHLWASDAQASSGGRARGPSG